MTLNRRTVVLRGVGSPAEYHDEKVVGEAGIYPGMLLELRSDDKIYKHATRTGRHMRYFAKENDFFGNTIDDVLTSGDSNGMFHRGQPGDVINALAKSYSPALVIGDWVTSNGDGTLVKAASAVFANVVAASTALPQGTSESTFDNSTVTIPANSLNVGDVIRIRGQAVVSNQNSTDTLTFKLKIGSTVLVTSGAVDVATGDVASFDFTIVVRTIGVSGTVFGFGTIALGVPGTVTAKAVTLASTTVDTTAAVTLTATGQWSVSNASNVVALQTYLVDKVTASSNADTAVGGDLVGQVVDEAVDPSASATDVRVAVELK